VKVGDLVRRKWPPRSISPSDLLMKDRLFVVTRKATNSFGAEAVLIYPDPEPDSLLSLARRLCPNNADHYYFADFFEVISESR
jgi:hypothetical protein